MERKTVLFLLIAVLADVVGLLADSPHAQARPLLASFTVNDTTDLIDDNLADGVCHTINNTCALRAAIMQANALGGSNTITLPSGVFTLTLTGSGEANTVTGDLDIQSNLTINGVSADSTVIDGNGTDRIFEIFGGVQVSISDLTIRNGFPGMWTTGGGIRNNGGTLNLSHVIVSDNHVSDNNGEEGGGIYSDGTLILADVTIKNNTGAIGGGIASNSGALTITDSTITNNTSSFNSGGILSAGTTKLTNVVISNNVVTDTNGYMGGIGIAGIAELTNVTIISNTAPYHSGGIGNGGVMTITASTISGNYSRYGGGVFNSNQGRLTISASTISTNTAAATGGGISAGGYLTLTNVTISGNTARFAGGGLENGGSATLTNVTFSSNTNTDTQVPRTGGTLFNSHYESSSVNLKNTIVANTLAGGNCLVDIGAIISSGYNMSSDDTCPFTATGDMTNTNPLLGPLYLNAPGSTLTHALLPNSPAIDKGDHIDCPTTDQRGVPRPQNGRCDIGAFESQGFTLRKTGGDSQSATINTAFATPLGLAVTSAYGEPVNGGKVTFTAPSSGASTNPTVYIATIASGTVSQSVTANGTVGGPYNVAASATGATSVNFSLTNDQANTTTSVTSSPNPSTHGQSATFTATVTSTVGTPTGTVAFKDSGADITGCTAQALNGSGQATCSTSALAVGTHANITGVYSGDTNFSGSTSSAYSHTVSNPVPTITSISPTSAAVNAPDFTLTITGTNFIATSVVRWNGSDRTTTYVSSTKLTAAISKNDLSAAGNVNVTVFNPTPRGGTSNIASFTIVATKSTVMLTSAPHPSMLGQAVTFTATVTNTVSPAPARAVRGPRDATPAGTVTFYDNDAVLGTGALNANGQATYTTAALLAGTHPITATFPGDANFSSGTSNQVNQVVNNPVPTITLISPTSAAVNAPDFTLTVTGTNFINGAVVRFGSNDLATTFSNSTQLTALVPKSFLSAAGNVNVIVVNPSNYASTPTTFTITPTNSAVTVTLSSSCNPCFSSQVVRLTATVVNTIILAPVGTVRAPRDAMPGGTVTFQDGGTNIPGCINVPLNGAGQAVGTTSFQGGRHTITALYSGDTNFNPATGTLTLNINYILLLPHIQKH